MRQLMEIHRENALCESCHARMDPLGLALENYSAMGTWRNQTQGSSIDTSGELITGEKFANIEQLAQIIVNQRRRDFYRCLTEKLFVFAIGRGVEYYDAPTVDRIVESLQSSEGKARLLIYGIVESVAFQYVRTAEPKHP